MCDVKANMSSLHDEFAVRIRHAPQVHFILVEIKILTNKSILIEFSYKVITFVDDIKYLIWFRSSTALEHDSSKIRVPSWSLGGITIEMY